MTCILTALGVVHNLSEHKCSPPNIFKCTANTVQPFKCKLICSFETHLKVILKKHVVCYHNKRCFLYDSVKNRKCSTCDFETYSVLVLLKHELKHEVKHELKLDSKPNTKPKDRAHKVRKNRKQHNKDENTFKCSICYYQNSNELIMKEHIQRIHNNPSLYKQDILRELLSKDKGKWYECEQCSFKCRMVHQLKDHIYNRHTDDKDKVWFKCEQMCTRKHRIDRHVSNCHTFKNNIQCKCEQCLKYMMKNRLNDVLKRHCQSESGLQ